MTYDAQGALRVRPVTRLAGAVTPPGAKSGTVRAVLCATLADGSSSIVGAGSGDNIRAMVRAGERLGARFDLSDERTWKVVGTGHELPETVELDAGNSGIVLRLLGALGAATRRCVVGTPFPESLGRRGNAELIDALRQLGADASGTGDEARPPLVVGRGAGLRGGVVNVSGRRSSQFLSGLLFLAPLVGDDVEIVVADTLSAAPMVRMTVDAMATAGVRVDVSDDGLRYRIAGGQRYTGASFAVASDASSMAGLVAAAAAVPDSAVRITGFAGDDQGTLAMLDTVRRMGASVERDGDVVTVRGTDSVRPIEMDGSVCPDSILPIAALACYADGTSVFSNIETMRYKECDRISDFRAEMRAAGADVDERRDAIIVHGRPRVSGGGPVSGRHDHSVVMALAVLALRSDDGVSIQGWPAVGQTYRGFFDDLRSLGADVSET
jgi:3-phosphoshikimate 1-carboxyvinyltransferase